MESIFLSVLNRSIAAGWLILAIAVLRLILRKAPKSLRLYLWALVLARLVFPPFGESPLSLLPSAETVPQTVLERDAFYVQSGIAVFNSTVNEHLVDFYETTPVPAGHTQSVVLICAAVWLAGAALMVLWAVLSYLRLRRRTADAVPEGGGVWLCGRIGSPFLLGIFRPRIYLPEGLDTESRTYVLAHERAHLRRRDHLTKPLGWLLLSVYWFHPLVWLAYALFCRDVELACDERVIAELGAASKKPYSAALLACSVRGSGLAVCPLAFGEAGVKERVKNVLNYKKPAFWVVLACIAAVVVVGVCFLTDPVSEREPPESDVSFTNRGASQPEKPTVFAAGALLYMDWAMSYQPVDGGGMPVLYGTDTLTLGREPVTYRLEETISMAWDNLYDYFPKLAEEEEYYGTLLTGHNDLVITARFYGDGSGDPGPSVWTIQEEGGGQRWWLYYGGRLFALINLDDAFPFLANGALWTYAPDQSDILPIRFDIEGGAKVRAGPDGLLSLDPRDSTWVDHLDVEAGQTIYWKPPLDGEGKPMANTGLHYYYDSPARYYDESGELRNMVHRAGESLTIRPAMDYAGLYGGVTYGVSNNWLGAASSAMHFSYITADSETYDLVVAPYSGGDPYETRAPEDGAESARGTTGPITVYDVPADPGDVVQWEYTPAMSSRYPAMPFSFDVSCQEVVASCDNGFLIDFDHEHPTNGGYPQGKSLTIQAPGKLYWAPQDSGTNAAAVSSKVTFSVLDSSGSPLYEGALAIVQLEETSHGAVYSAMLEAGSGLTLTQNTSESGGLLR